MIISTPKLAHRKLHKIRTELEQILSDKRVHEEKKRTAVPSLSLTDFMNARQMQSSFPEREKLAKQFGMKEYHGTREHDSRLLAILQSQHGRSTDDTTK